LHEVSTQFSYAQEFLYGSHWQTQPLSQDRKATTQRANGKGVRPFEYARTLGPDFLMFHGEQIPAQSLFRL
jgi:hypothetical protein